MKRFNPAKVYKCNKLIRDWLIYQKHISILGQSEDGNWLFARTDKLKEALKDIPIYLKLVDNLNK